MSPYQVFCLNPPPNLPGGRWWKNSNFIQDWRAPATEQKGIGLDRVEREKASSHLGDIRSVLCEQRLPAGEQSRSLELRYYRLPGPSAWKCTCRRAGLGSRRDTGGGGWASLFFFFLWSVCLCVSCHSVCSSPRRVHSLSPPLVTCSHAYSSLVCLLYHLSPRLSLLLPICCFLFPVLHHHCSPSSSSPHVVLHSSPPSFKRWWAAEQYPGGHGDRQPPPCALFLPLSLVLLPLGSCTPLTAHTAA